MHFSHFNIGASTKFLRGFFKQCDNLIFSLKKIINWYLLSHTNASVYSFSCNNNTNVMVQKFQDFVGQFTPVKWNVSHNLVGMKIILNYCNCILAVPFAFLFFTVQSFITHSGLPICPYKRDTLRLKDCA